MGGQPRIAGDSRRAVHVDFRFKLLQTWLDSRIKEGTAGRRFQLPFEKTLISGRFLLSCQVSYYHCFQLIKDA
jgi:hypothetical protein